MFVLLGREADKAKIKLYLDSKGIVSQFLLFKNMEAKAKSLAVMGNVLRQVNAKVRRDNLRLELPKSILSLDTMFVGLDVCHSGRKSMGVKPCRSISRSTTSRCAREM